MLAYRARFVQNTALLFKDSTVVARYRIKRAIYQCAALY